MIRTKIAKILVPLDGSKTSFNGLDMAIFLARQCGAIITGLHVVSIYPQHMGELVTPLKAKLIANAEKFMEQAKVKSAQNGIVFRHKIIYGDAKSDMLDFIKQNKFDLVVIGSRGMGGIKEAFLGSVSNAIVHKSHVPVLVVK
ncbi:MAG: universal stress protein [Nitrosopumilales archaeon]|nr:MAG: universal stress protein [Nitrosopumilales archaeon]